MNRTKIVSLIVCALTVLLAFSSCNDSGSDTTSDFVSYETIRNEGIKLDESYENLRLPADSISNNAQKLYTFSADWGSASLSEQHKTKLIDFISAFSGKEPNEGTVTKDNSYGYSYSDQDLAAFITSAGSFGVSRIKSGIAVLENYISTERVIHIDRGDDLNEVFSINGKDYSVKDAVADADSFLNKINIGRFISDDEKISAKYAAVIKTYGSEPPDEEGNPPETEPTYCYKLYYSILKEGIPFSETGGIPTDDDKGFPYNSYLDVVITEKGEIGAVEFQAYVNTNDEKECSEKMLTCDAALRRLSEYLSEYKVYDVSEVGIVYCAIAHENDEKLYYHPMWRVILEEYQTDVNIQLFVKAAYIDMLSGDIYLFDDDKGLMLGVEKASDPM